MLYNMPPSRDTLSALCLSRGMLYAGPAPYLGASWALLSVLVEPVQKLLARQLWRRGRRACPVTTAALLVVPLAPCQHAPEVAHTGTTRRSAQQSSSAPHQHHPERGKCGPFRHCMSRRTFVTTIPYQLPAAWQQHVSRCPGSINSSSAKKWLTLPVSLPPPHLNNHG